MANEIRLIQATGGAVVKQRSLCYASTYSPRFSEWAKDNGKRLKEELEKAYSRTAEDIQLLLTGELEPTDAQTQNLCVAIEEAVKQYRAELEPAR
jgi:hypothetical protein